MIRLHVSPGTLAAEVLPFAMVAAEVNPGEHTLVLVTGERELRLGPKWQVDTSMELVAELEEYGDVEVIEDG